MWHNCQRHIISCCSRNTAISKQTNKTFFFWHHLYRRMQNKKSPEEPQSNLVHEYDCYQLPHWKCCGSFPGLFVDVCACFYKVLHQEQNTSKPCVSCRVDYIRSFYLIDRGERQAGCDEYLLLYPTWPPWRPPRHAAWWQSGSLTHVIFDKG